MAVIVAVSDYSYDPLQAQARMLFRAYSEFLRISLACGSFDFAAFEEETRALPEPYRSRRGAVLLALVDEYPAACVAFRATLEDAASCEIKRLFVLPEFRNLGLARLLVREALRRLAAAGFTRCILDTDTATMPAALALYVGLGFREYVARQGGFAFLELAL